jgi:hypothetical protein
VAIPAFELMSHIESVPAYVSSLQNGLQRHSCGKNYKRMEKGLLER